MKKLRPVMFVGTCSDAGKSVLNTAFCRIFRQDGYRPAPFKAQNMSLNSYSTPEGGEMGRAQAVQAEACGILPHTDMNPVLLKPSTDQTSQVILNGQPVGNRSAREYFRQENTTELFPQALAAFRRLEAKYNPVVLEGAGSISELNLRDRDFTNMRMAREVGAATYLVADIDRGGVFGSVYGSVLLLPKEERECLKGIIINKFRGDVSLFTEGKKLLEQLTGIPVVGVIPFFRDIHIEQEDSLELKTKNTTAGAGKINVAVVLLRHMSNFTDFNALERDERFHLYFTQEAGEIRKADIVVLPGTKSTIADLKHLHSEGIAEAIIQARKEGKKVIGICGGYQMMGMRVEDPDHVEGPETEMEGLKLLPLVSVMRNKKVVSQNRFHFKGYADWCEGYQIHMGETFLAQAGGKPSPLNVTEDGNPDGYWLDAHCWGSYMHGILDNPAVLNDLAVGLGDWGERSFDYKAFRQQQYELLAEHVRKAVDMEYVYSTLRI